MHFGEEERGPCHRRIQGNANLRTFKNGEKSGTIFSLFFLSEKGIIYNLPEFHEAREIRDKRLA